MPCLTMTIPQASAPLKTASSGLLFYLTVISRLSCRPAGTRFNSRGIDNNGNVAKKGVNVGRKNRPGFEGALGGGKRK